MTNTTNAETPETDGEVMDARNVALDWECSYDKNKKDPEVVEVEFARSLERSRNALKSENERLKEQIEKWKALAEDMHHEGNSGTLDYNGDPYGGWKNAKAWYEQLKKESES